MKCIGNTAFIDLGSGDVRIEETPVELVRRFLGGRGLNMFYLHSLLEPGTDPFSGENPLIFGAGLLTGTGAPSSSRFNVSAKSPETYILGDANCGHRFGPWMRFSGFDRLVITGRSAVPVYIHLDEGRIEVREAGPWWGMNAREVQEGMREALGRKIEIACIGRAGEKRVRFAGIMNGEKATAARCGLGAVMGSKNLKAIVAAGNAPIEVERREELFGARRELNTGLQGARVIQALGRFGTALLYRPSNLLGAIRTKNSQQNAFSESLDAEEIHRFTEKMYSCYNCIVHCRHRNRMGGGGPEYTTIGLLGANCGIDDPEKVILLNNLCNDLGLDTSSVGTIIPWAIELYERGLIDDKTTGGRRLAFGDYELVRDLIVDISERRGFGDILAESTRAVEIFGPESADFLIAVKGLPQTDPHDCRIIKSFALGIAVSSRGADHLRNRPTLDIFNLPEALTTKIYGRKIDPEITSYDTKDAMVYFHENIYAVVDALGLCKFICHGFNSPHLVDYEDFSGLIRLAADLEFSREDLEAVAHRILDTERLINMREGVTREDDTLPRRYFEDGVPLKAYEGHRIEREKFREMLAGYYRLRGWDDEGRPADARGEELHDLKAAMNL
jgi:aldehyde:ferredoxin oxidoreductase